MGLFSRKKDPIKVREKVLATEIEQLEDQIRALQGVLKEAKDGPHLRQAVYPGGREAPKSAPAAAPAASENEPVFEPVDQQRLQDATPNPFKDKHDPAALQREGSPSFFERFMRFFRGPKSSNPKLISYLAAGNIHGLQPLRYERRVARNRLLLWIAIIIVVIFGLLKSFLH